MRVRVLRLDGADQRVERVGLAVCDLFQRIAHRDAADRAFQRARAAVSGDDRPGGGREPRQAGRGGSPTTTVARTSRRRATAARTWSASSPGPTPARCGSSPAASAASGPHRPPASVTALATSSTVLIASSPGTGAEPQSTVGSIAMAVDAEGDRHRREQQARHGATGRRTGRSAPSGRAAAARQPANVASARTGSRATHMFIGLPKMPGVVSPWPSIMNPTATQPSASSTGAARPSRTANDAVASATNSAHAAMALTT